MIYQVGYAIRRIRGGGFWTPVFAGTINQSGVLEIRTEKIGRDTAFGRIIEAVERAERSRAPIQRTADRLAGYLVYFALGCAAAMRGPPYR
jgi:cation transport ATPase